jgi:TP901 family phage tail tape measure protein
MPDTTQNYRNSITLDISEALAQLGNLKEGVLAVQTALATPIKPTLDISAITSGISEIKTQLSSIKKIPVNITLNAEGVKAGIAEIQVLLDQLKTQKISIPIGVVADTGIVTQEIMKLHQEAAKYKITLNIYAQADLQSLQNALSAMQSAVGSGIVVPIRYEQTGGAPISGGGYDWEPTTSREQEYIVDPFEEITTQSERRSRPTRTRKQVASELGLNFVKPGVYRSSGGKFATKEQVENLKRTLEEEGFTRFSAPGIARGPYSVEPLPFSQIKTRTSDFQMREALNESRVAEIQKSLEAGDLKQLTEIAVWRTKSQQTGETENVLLSGHHRLEAAKRAKGATGEPLFSGISARVYENMQYDEARLLSELENVNVKSYSPYEMSKRMANIRNTSEQIGTERTRINYDAIENRYGGAIKKSTLRGMWNASFLPEEWMRSMSMGSDVEQQRMLGIAAPFGQQAELGNLNNPQLLKIFREMVVPGKIQDTRTSEIIARRLGSLSIASSGGGVKQGDLFNQFFSGGEQGLDVLSLEANVAKGRGSIKTGAGSLLRNLERMTTGGEKTELTDVIAKIEPELKKIVDISSKDIQDITETVDTTITKQYVDSIIEKEREIAARLARGKYRAERLHELRGVKTAGREKEPILPGEATRVTEPTRYAPEGGFGVLSSRAAQYQRLAETQALTSQTRGISGEWEATPEQKTLISAYEKEYGMYKGGAGAPQVPLGTGRGARRVAGMPGLKSIREELGGLMGAKTAMETQIAGSIRKSITSLPFLTNEQRKETEELLKLIPNDIIAQTKELRNIRFSESIRTPVTTKDQYQSILREYGRERAADALAKGGIYSIGTRQKGIGINFAREVSKEAGLSYRVGATDITLRHELAHALGIQGGPGKQELGPDILELLKSKGIDVSRFEGKYKEVSWEEQSKHWLESQEIIKREEQQRALVRQAGGYGNRAIDRYNRRIAFTPAMEALQQPDIYKRLGLTQNILGIAAQRVGGARPEEMLYPTSPLQEPAVNLGQYTKAPGRQGLLSQLTTSIYRGPLKGLMTSPWTFGQVPPDGMWDKWQGDLADRSLQPGFGGKAAGAALDIMDAPQMGLLSLRQSKFGRAVGAGVRGFKQELADSAARSMVASQRANAERIATELSRRAYTSFLESSVQNTVNKLLGAGIPFEQARNIATEQIYGILYGQQPGQQSGQVSFSAPGTQAETPGAAQAAAPGGQPGLMTGLYANNANPAYGPGGMGLKGGPFSLGGSMRHAAFFAEGTMIYMALSGLMNAIQNFVGNATTEAEKWSGVAARINFVTDLPEASTNRYMQAEMLRAYTYGVGPAEAGEAQLIATRSATGKYQEQRELMQGAAQVSVLSGEEMSDTMEMLITLQKQYNVEAGETQKIVDVIAYAYKNSTDSIDSLTDALARSGSATKMMGLNLEESFAVISGISEVSTRTGTSIAAMLTQMSRVMYSTTGKSLLASVGIGVTADGKEKSSWDVITEASKVWQTDISDAQRRAIATGIGGPRYSSDVAAFFENFEEINQSRMTASQEAGGSMGELMKSLSKDVGYQYQRTQSAYQNYIADPGRGINVWRKFYDTWRERSYIGKDIESQLENDKELVDKLGIKNVFGGKSQDPTYRLFRMVKKETDLSGVELSREVALRVANAQDELAGLPEGTTAKAAGLGIPESYRTLDMLSTTKMTGPEADQLTEAVLEWQKKLEDQGFSQENQVEKNILVQRGIDTKIESIVGTTEAIELATAEIAENTKMRGVWNIPTGWVPIESIFTGASQVKEAAADTFRTVSPEENAVAELIGRKSNEQIKMIEEGDYVAGTKMQEKAIELPMISKGERQSASDAQKVSQILESEKSTLLSYNPYVATGSKEVNKTTKEVTSESSQLTITIPVMLDGEKVGEAVAVVDGNSLIKNIRSGGNYGSHSASVVGGVL